MNKIEQERVRQQARATIAFRIADTIDNLVNKAALVGLFVCGYYSIKEIAGKTTTFSSVINWVFQLDAGAWAGYALAAIFGTTTVLQTKLRKKEVERLSAYARELEIRLDPDRSSSGLALDGTPQKAQLIGRRRSTL